MTDTHIINALRDVIAQDYGTEALAIDGAVITLERQGHKSDSLRNDVQRVWDKQFKVWGAM
jgi:hypothetical protein